MSRRSNPSEYEELAKSYLNLSEDAMRRDAWDSAEVWATHAATYATLALFAVQRLGSPAYYEQDV